jgi:hypothetical protein
MATVLIGGLLGLIGTLLGAGLTTWTARQTAARSERSALREVRRQEFRAAVTRFATTLLTYRLAEMDRWHARHTRHGQPEDGKTGAAEVYRTRTMMWDAYYQLELSTGNSEVRRLAQRALDRARSIKEPDSKDEMNHRADQVQEDLAEMISLARVAGAGYKVDLPEQLLAPDD